MLNVERLRCRLLNSIFRRLCKSDYRRFINTEHVEQVQRDKLFQLLRKNQDSWYGKLHHFNSIQTYEQYQQQVPQVRYEDLLPAIKRIAAGENGVLTTEKVLMFEPTGGSSGGSKRIPYTQGLKEEMQRGIRPWLYDLYTAYPEILWGKSYWSVTPASSGRTHTAGGVPIGFEDDTDYFGTLERHLLRGLFAVPQEIAGETDLEQFYFKTSLALLDCEHLTLVSVWNPTYFTLLLDYMHRNREALLAALPPRRAKAVEAALASKRFEQIWPGLRLISCWGDANAATYAAQLARCFPNAVLQPKGVLATEGMLTFPLVGQRGGCLSIFSHFYEFIEPDSGKLLLAHQLEQGRVYEVVMSTGGGLYRYRIGDLVQVVGHRGQLPLLVFKGRGDRSSDLFGEKLHESFVEGMLRHFGLDDTFALVAPETDHYVLYCCDRPNLPGSFQLDEYLRQNFHYDYCRKLGQLGPLRIYLLTGSPEQEYLAGCVANGQKLGDIKPASLVSFGGWSKHFTGYCRKE